MDDEEIDVVNFDVDTEQSIRNIEKSQEGTSLACNECDYVGRTKSGLSAHRRHKHPKPEDSAKKQRAQNAKKRKEQDEEEPERITTKQLLGGRKRPKTVVENVEELSGNRAQQEFGLDMEHANMSVGEYAARKVTGCPIDGDIDDIGGAMVVGEEVVIEGEEMDGDPSEIPMITQFLSKKYIPRQRRPDTNRLPIIHDKPNHISNRIVHGDEEGKYVCYIEHCGWKGNYRSLRMDHMKTIHPDWKMPSRYLLQRISKDGLYINPDDYVPPIKCNVLGCEWRGNYRASRSAHMKKVHPEEHAEGKKKLPGYDCKGTYMCHFPTCSWRGWSRSTRSQHLKKEHPEWRPEDSRLTTLLTCFHCKTTVPSYGHLVSHIAQQHGGVGLHVEQVFESREVFSTWLKRIEGLYQMNFERTDSPINVGADYIHYTLHCSCVGGRGIQIATDSRNFIYQNYNFLKRRDLQFLTRSKNDCSAHLEIREDPYNEIISVKGSLEHTGHRFGTPLVRMSPMDRQLYSEILEMKNTEDIRVPALDVVDKLNNFEGFQMDNYSFVEPVDLIEPRAEDPLVSLKMIIRDESDEDCFFDVNFLEAEEGRCSFGYMSPEMKRLWSEYGPGRVVTVDVNEIEFDSIDLFQFTVLVNDEEFVPKCVLIYLSTEQATGYDVVLTQLKFVDGRSPIHLMCDASQAWIDSFEKIYPEVLPSVFISEWTLMDYWAARTEQIVENEFDVYCIVTALRRLLRTEEPHQFMFFVVEIFEALYECGYDRLADFLDAQLSDTEYFKRWSPCHRGDFTSHGHPTLAVSSNALRNLYLTTEGIDRVDQWFVWATKRIAEFNDVQITKTFTTRPLYPPKKFYYDTFNYRDFHKQVDEQDTGEVVFFTEEVEAVEGIAYEEGVEVVGEEIIEEEMMYQEVMAKDPRRAETSRMEHPHHHQELEELQEHHHHLQEDQDLQEHHHHHQEHQDLQEHHHHHQEHQDLQEQHHLHQEHQQEDDMDLLMRTETPVEEEPLDEVLEPSMESMDPERTLSEPIEPVEDPEDPLDVSLDHLQDQPSTSTAPPYHARRKKSLSPSAPKKRETTRSVVRGRKNKDRFADLRACPPEVMKAIAAHAIAYDGRKKEQRPFMHLPSEAQLGTSDEPVLPTPDLKPYFGVPIPTSVWLAARRDPTNPKLKLIPSMVPPRNWGSNKDIIVTPPSSPPRRRQIIFDHRQPSTSSSSLMPHQQYQMNLLHPHPHRHNLHHLHQHQHLEHHQKYLSADFDDDDQLGHPHDDRQPCTSASLYN